MGKYNNYNQEYFDTKFKFHEDYLNSSDITSSTRSMFQLLNIFGINKRNILEIGSGTGILASILINKGAKYYGIDISEYAINRSIDTINKKCQSSDYVIKEGSINDLNKLFPNITFDYIVFQSTLEHIFLEDIQKFYVNIYASLKKYGKIIVGNPYFPTGLHLKGNKWVGHHVTNINKVFVEELEKNIFPRFKLVLHISGFFVLEKNESREPLRINLLNNKNIEHIKLINGKYILVNQHNFFLRHHFFRKPLHLIKRLLQLSDYF